MFPNEEKEFIFSFYSEKNGTFGEDWTLVTSPPLKGCNLTIHLSGLCLLKVDKYSNSINEINNKINNKAIKTMINEIIVDLVYSIKPDLPALPDMNDEDVFKFYFELLNKEYKYEKNF